MKIINKNSNIFPGALVSAIMALYFGMIDLKIYIDSGSCGTSSVIITEVIGLIIFFSLTNYSCNKAYNDARQKK